ncbi:hypothetical protein K0M31_002980 [Melipona bicolor]|uniref:Uncharacterized protein n=1 Tax=Melipona bicolor TaxID=60889 RepID=A0AA40G055_9HYME|nr:hypothetical protein K0M31_002980 [Melipona bicolor]
MIYDFLVLAGNKLLSLPTIPACSGAHNNVKKRSMKHRGAFERNETPINFDNRDVSNCEIVSRDTTNNGTWETPLGPLSLANSLGIP